MKKGNDQTVQKEKTIGITVPFPKEDCHDDKCPFHGSLKVRGRTFTGTVVSDKMQNTATIEWARRRYNKKYERFEVRRSRIKAHNPKCIDAKTGEKVTIIETRPLSKTKNFVIIAHEQGAQE